MGTGTPHAIEALGSIAIPPPRPAIDSAHMHAGLATAAPAADAPQVLADKTVAVVGGGPGGILCAAHLARLGAPPRASPRTPTRARAAQAEAARLR